MACRLEGNAEDGLTKSRNTSGMALAGGVGGCEWGSTGLFKKNELQDRQPSSDSLGTANNGGGSHGARGTRKSGCGDPDSRNHARGSKTWTRI